jgi:hypothetical protein
MAMLAATEFAARHPAECPPRSFTTIETSHFWADSYFQLYREEPG